MLFAHYFSTRSVAVVGPQIGEDDMIQITLENARIWHPFAKTPPGEQTIKVNAAQVNAWWATQDGQGVHLHGPDITVLNVTVAEFEAKVNAAMTP